MNNQQGREQFAAELKRRGLPRAYIERLLAELDDHITDLQDERNSDMNTARKPETSVESQAADVVSFQERIGDPAQLARFAEQQYRRRSFLGRHPILTFLVLPLPLVVAGLVAVGLSVFALGYVVDLFAPDGEVGQGSLGEYLSGAVFFWLLIVIPPFSTVTFLCRVARRNASSWRWIVATCALIAFYCAELFVTWNLPPVQGHTAMGIGIACLAPFSGVSLQWFVCRFVPQFVVAFGVGLLLVKRAQRIQKMDESREKTAELRRAA